MCSFCCTKIVIFVYNVCTLTDEFAINADTGVMTVVGDLDQEDISMYTLTVQAENNMATGASPSTVSEKYS